MPNHEVRTLRPLARPKIGVLIVALIIAAVAVAYYYSPTMSNLPTQTNTTASQYSPSQYGNASLNAAPGNWPTYHKDLFRSGFEPSITAFSSVRLNWKSAGLDGDAYAEPLVVGKYVIVATENNSVYDLNADSGRIVWHTNFGTPVNGRELPCGDIDPSGITGTPVVDVSGRTVFVVAFLDHPLHHELFALNLDTGEVKFHLPIDPPGADITVQQQRAALALANGYVYVAYGGLYGDCGPYHGWVAASTETGGPVISYEVPTGRAGGIWAPSGIAVDSSGNLLVATGNSDATTTFDFGDSVIKLTPNLKPLNWFAPSNWADLNSNDLDLGSTGPIILSPNVLFQIGKDGTGYLVDAKNLGGVNGQLYKARVCDGAFGGLAYSQPYLLVSCIDGLLALNVNLGPNPSFRISWRDNNLAPGPPIIAGNAVWTVDVSNGLIYAVALADGRTLFQDPIGPVTHFTSLGAGNGQIFVSGSRRVSAYLPQNNTQSYALLPDLASSINSVPLSPCLQGLAVALAGSQNSDFLSRILAIRRYFTNSS